ncbi:ATP-binding protein [Formosa sp. L2A11]|uniref:DEAD/DEAH box helicase n=1 Tax=Formosa sp. L2A11 TaxID=2686363 RepID=UPI00131BB4F2|nr:AAA domain-containing protein [Formosa sp. L2A11]
MKAVFEKIIKKWHDVDHNKNAYNEKQLTNLLYKHHLDLELVTQALEEYNVYFNRVRRYLYLPKWDKVMRDFPLWFGVIETQNQEIAKAFIDEEYAIEDDNAKLWIIAKVNKPISNSNYGFLYEARISLPDGVSSPSQEGVSINLWWKDVSQFNNIQGLFLAYYRKTSSIIFRVSYELSEEHLQTKFQFKPKPLNFLKDVKNRFNAAHLKTSSLTHQLFYKKDFLKFSTNKSDSDYPGLNSSQKQAFTQVFSQNVTFIWGPPGTGKTYTLSKIITKACCLGFRVLAVGISNVSIDVLGGEIINEFENYNETSKALINDRKLLRFGYPVLSEIVNDNRLYPDKELVDALRKEYGNVLKLLRGKNNLNLEEKALLRNRQVLLKNEIKQSNQKRISESQLVFTTAAQCFIGDNFENEKFDLVVVDEVGMMPLVQTLTMASFTKDKFVVAGDFKQLGPISTGRTQAVYTWFNKDIFDFFKDVDNYEDRLRVMLTEQRRMHPEICEFVNNRFYNGKLTTQYTQEYKHINVFNNTLSSPYCFIPIDSKSGSRVKSTEGKSRVNVKTAVIITNLVEDILINNANINIGVITPYNGQVRCIKNYIFNKKLSNENLDRVKVGTVHAFQGSGFDMIIYDLVDNSEKNIGRLYKGIQGERLLNVGLSRAKHKLIIVGDPKIFSMTDELQEVSKKLRSFMVDLRMSKNQLSLENLEYVLV